MIGEITIEMKGINKTEIEAVSWAHRSIVLSSIRTPLSRLRLS